MPNAFGEDTDEEREDSPLPGVDDDEEMESPRAAGGEAPDEQEEVVPDTQGDAQSTSQAQADAQSTSGAAVTHPSPMLDGAVAECEAAPLDHGAIPLPCLGKRRDLAVGETGVEAASGKRGCHGSVPAHPAAVSEGLTFTALDGTTFKVFRKAPPKKSAAEQRGQAKLLKEDIFKLDLEVAEHRKHREAQATAASSQSMDVAPDVDSACRPNNKLNAAKMLVDAYRPKSFINLLSNERDNRAVLEWLNKWRPFVFGTDSTTGKPLGSTQDDVKRALASKDFDGRCHHRLPEQKILVLYGPPGTGKTTLAHVIARQAGYSPAEINASDERGKGLKERLDSLVSMKAHFTDGRPNCVIMDEIDGCQGAEGAGAVDILLKYIRDTNAAERARDGKAKKWGGGGRGSVEADGLGGADDLDHEGETEMPRDTKLKFKGTRTNLKKGGKENSKKALSASKKGPQMLQRPIICICNDLYAPALRALRKEAKCIKITAPSTQRMVGRLQIVCQKEKMKADRLALTALHELHTGDIRSCLNALEMLAVDGGTIDKARVLQQAASVRDNGSGNLFDLWTQVFRVAGAQGNGQAKKVADDKDEALRALRSQLQSHFSSMSRILVGCHQNYASVRYVDPRLEKTSRVLEELCVADVIDQQIKSQQHWGLSPYLGIGVLNFHVECAAPPFPKVEFPRELNESVQRAKANSSVWETMMVGMEAEMRQMVGSRWLMPVEIGPQLKNILSPNIKNSHQQHLMSSEDTARLQAHAQIMASMGLSYEASRDSIAAQGEKLLLLEPPVDKIVSFTKDAREDQPMAQILCQNLQRQIKKVLHEKELAFLRKPHVVYCKCKPAVDITKCEVCKGSQQCGTTPGTEKKVKSTSSRVTGMEYFENSAKHASAEKKRNPITCANTHPVRYKFTQGLTNAIKRPVSIKDLMA